MLPINHYYYYCYYYYYYYCYCYCYYYHLVYLLFQIRKPRVLLLVAPLKQGRPGPCWSAEWNAALRTTVTTRLQSRQKMQSVCSHQTVINCAKHLFHRAPLCVCKTFISKGPTVCVQNIYFKGPTVCVCVWGGGGGGGGDLS